MPKFTPISVHDLGDYLREQRHTAQLSLRQLSDVAGISNPYLSQIERGLKRPSAEILQALAKALRISAESLYIRAGILEERADRTDAPVDVPAAILADPLLTNRQRGVLMDVYESFVSESAFSKPDQVPAPTKAAKAQPRTKTAKAPKPTKVAKATGADIQTGPTQTSPAPIPAPSDNTEQSLIKENQL